MSVGILLRTAPSVAELKAKTLARGRSFVRRLKWLNGLRKVPADMADATFFRVESHDGTELIPSLLRSTKSF